MSSFLLALLIGASPTPQPVPSPQMLQTVALRAPAAVLRVQVARTEEQREVGLMGVRKLARHTGMLFVFPTDAPVTFWMKNTLIPLDMVFFSKDGFVRSIAAGVRTVPLDTPDNMIPLEPGIAKYVLELPAGEAALDGLRSGVKISLPS